MSFGRKRRESRIDFWLVNHKRRIKRNHNKIQMEKMCEIAEMATSELKLNKINEIFSVNSALDTYTQPKHARVVRSQLYRILLNFQTLRRACRNIAGARTMQMNLKREMIPFSSALRMNVAEKMSMVIMCARCSHSLADGSQPGRVSQVHVAVSACASINMLTFA